MRGADGASATSADEGVSLIDPPTRISHRDALRLAWHRVADADAYRVELLDTTGALVHAQVTSDTTIVLSPTLLPSGDVQVDWIVVARRAGPDQPGHGGQDGGRTGPDGPRPRTSIVRPNPPR